MTGSLCSEHFVKNILCRNVLLKIICVQERFGRNILLGMFCGEDFDVEP
jgi:hypothetical protein